MHKQVALAGAALAAVAVAQSETKIYGAETIKRHIQKQKPDYARGASGSIADQPHENNRQAARLARQAARKAAKLAKA
jgi:hypothetical protein